MMLDFIRSLYYGEYWLIAWAVTLAPLVVGIIIDIVNTVKSRRQLEKRGK